MIEMIIMIAKIVLLFTIRRVIEVASRATVLVSMTVLQQQQPSPVCLSLPLSLPLAEAPLLMIVAHSSANANLLVHSLAIAGEQGTMWSGNLHQSLAAEVRVVAAWFVES